MKESDIVEGVRQSLESCRLAIKESIECAYDVIICPQPIESRRTECKKFTEKIIKKAESIQTILQMKTPSWVIEALEATRGMENNSFSSRHFLRLFQGAYPACSSYTFSIDFNSTNDQISFHDVDVVKIDQRICEIIQELEDIVNNHGAKITAQIEKELIALIIRIKKSQVHSLFGRKAALFMLMLFLSNFSGDKSHIIDPAAKEKMDQIESKTKNTIAEIRRSEEEALINNVKGMTFNGCTVSITGSEIKMIEQKP